MRRRQNSFLVYHHREFPWQQPSFPALHTELQSEILAFQAQHNRYIKSTKKITRQLIDKLEELIFKTFPTFRVGSPDLPLRILRQRHQHALERLGPVS